MPVLDGKAIDTDPEGTAFLRRVIRPGFEGEKAAEMPAVAKQVPPTEGTGDPPRDPEAGEAAIEPLTPVPAA